jgi:hypothetical protein
LRGAAAAADVAAGGGTEGPLAVAVLLVLAPLPRRPLWTTKPVDLPLGAMGGHRPSGGGGLVDSPAASAAAAAALEAAAAPRALVSALRALRISRSEVAPQTCSGREAIVLVSIGGGRIGRAGIEAVDDWDEVEADREGVEDATEEMLLECISPPGEDEPDDPPDAERELGDREL